MNTRNGTDGWDDDEDDDDELETVDPEFDDEDEDEDYNDDDTDDWEPDDDEQGDEPTTAFDFDGTVVGFTAFIKEKPFWFKWLFGSETIVRLTIENADGTDGGTLLVCDPPGDLFKVQELIGCHVIGPYIVNSVDFVVASTRGGRCVFVGEK